MAHPSKDVPAEAAVGEPSGGPDAATSPEADALMARVVAGDQVAFARLYDRFGSGAYSLACLVCREPRIAEDVVQEVFTAIWRAPERFDPARGSVATWLLTLVHRRAVDAVRHESRRRRRSPVVTQPDGDGGGTGPPDPAADVALLETIAAGHVRAALQDLGPVHREALALAYFGGYTQAEIAALTGVALDTVKSRTFAAVGRLRAALAGEGTTDPHDRREP